MINPTYSTYSFSDTSVVLNHPSIGQCVLTGQGVGSIVVAYANDASSQEVAHDGSIMTNKVVLKNGTVSFTLLQTSSGNAWMKKAYSKLLLADASEWAQFNGTIENKTTGEVTTFSNACIQKLPDANFQQTGQNNTWTFLAGVIESL